MLARRICSYLKSYRHYRAATAIILLIFLFHSAALALIFYFTGRDTISNRLLESIPLETAYSNFNYFSNHYKGTRPDFRKAGTTFIRLVEALNELGRDETLSCFSYNLTGHFLVADCFPKQNVESANQMMPAASADAEPFLNYAFLAGIQSADFFAQNNIRLLETTGEPLSDETVYVPDTMVLRGEDGLFRPARLGDRVQVYRLGKQDHLGERTVAGIYEYCSKFDYSYGRDATFIELAELPLFVSNTSLFRYYRETIESHLQKWPGDSESPPLLETDEAPHIQSIVFRVGRFEDYPAFRARMKTVADELDTWCFQNGKHGVMLDVQEPRYLKMADSIRKTASLYRTIFLAVDAMLLILVGGLSWYLISRKKKEIFVFYSIGMKKRQIAAHYCGYYVTLALPAAILGAALGYALNLLLSIKIARDTVALQEELLGFSNNGQKVARAIDGTIRGYDVGPAAILGGSALTVAVTAVVTAGIVLLALFFILRKKPRDFVRGEGL